MTDHRFILMTTAGDLGWAGCAAVERDPLRCSGSWVFRGTRVPVAALFENLEDGVSVADFVNLFPGVTLEQARLVLEHAVPLRRYLDHHLVATAYELGWSTVTSGSAR